MVGESMGLEFSFKAVEMGRRASTMLGRGKQFPMAEMRVQSSSEKGVQRPGSFEAVQWAEVLEAAFLVDPPDEWFSGLGAEVVVAEGLRVL